MIICCGEALIDMIPKPTTEGATAFQPFNGGAVFNTAIALGRLGAPTAMLTGLSRDMFGEQLLAGLAESGVDASPSVRSDRPTTLAFVRLVDGQASYSFYDENSAGRMLSADDFPVLDDSITTAFFGGISLISEPCGTAYESLFTKLSENRVTMVDVNVRPGFINDEAAYRARVERMTSRADIVKM
ncbi:MAG: PfkB family carbohydrate kinase, partial [Gammaproteobacteria bacterium]